MPERLSLVELAMAIHDGLAAAGIGHAFGGAVALAYYVAEPRSTRDLDLNIAVPTDRAREVFDHLPGVPYGEADLRRTLADGQIRLWYGPPRDGVPIDLFFPQHEFHAVVARRAVERPFARSDYAIPVIAADHLAVFKILFDRPQDWVDMQNMLSAGSLDPPEVLRWVDRLLGPDHPSRRRFEELAAGTPVQHSSDPPDQERPSFDWRTVL